MHSSVSALRQRLSSSPAKSGRAAPPAVPAPATSESGTGNVAAVRCRADRAGRMDVALDQFEQFLLTVGFAQVFVDAKFEGDAPMFFGGPGGDHDDRDVAR